MEQHDLFPSSTSSPASGDSPLPSSPLWPTPTAQEDQKSPEAHMAMKARMKGGPRHTITSVTVMVKALEGSAPSASARSTPTPLPSLPTDGPTCPTSAPFSTSREIASLSEQVESRLKFLLRVSRASRSPSPENALAQLTNATSGPTLPKPFATLELESACLKTSPDYSRCRPQDVYAAGIIDGEGYIGIGKFTKRQPTIYQAKVEVTLSEKALQIIRWLKTEFGGNVYKKPDPKRPENASCYRWSIVGESAANFLSQISPALLLKQRQAEVVISLLKMMGPMPTSGRGRRWTQEMSEAGETHYQEIRRLNAKGPMQESVWATDQLRLDGSLETFSETFPRSGMLVSGRLYQLPPLALPTDAIESGSSASMSWPTVRASEHKDTGPNGSKSQRHMLARSYLCALVNEEEYSGPPPIPSGPLDPVSGSTDGSRRESWATPRSGKVTSEDEDVWRARQAKGDVATMPLTVQVGTGKLNPSWVETLMAFPIGWTQLPAKFVKPKRGTP